MTKETYGGTEELSTEDINRTTEILEERHYHKLRNSDAQKINAAVTSPAANRLIGRETQDIILGTNDYPQTSAIEGIANTIKLLAAVALNKLSSIFSKKTYEAVNNQERRSTIMPTGGSLNKSLKILGSELTSNITSSEVQDSDALAKPSSSPSLSSIAPLPQVNPQNLR